MKSKIFIATAILLATAFTTSAQNNRTLRDENRHIRHGVRNGELTAGETVRLKREETRLRKEAVRFKRNDGSIGRVERAKLRRDQKRLDRNIRRQKHDRQRRH
jgi:hypothetical protein